MASDGTGAGSDPPDAQPLTDLDWMEVALEEARRAIQHGDVPVGAVVVDALGRELGRGHNRREVDADPTAHAEILALRAAALARGHWRLDDCTVFVTLEPCAMCAGAMVNARLSRLVFGAADPKAGAVVSLFRLADDSRLNHRFAVTAGCAPEASVALLQAFFRVLRARGEK
ncbi:MAG TPA: nucleoside deaminase [Polyangiaceae bacterium]|jgi:tRNA(adenine34) deaminase|nr:nucleoside deaminase [Polyangiaceae bacterium]